jgi:rare lipoprotein A (peptidoglycan hydrolase)
MSMRVRRLGLAAIAVVAGASLLRTSIPLAISEALLDPTLNFTLSLAGAEGHSTASPSARVVEGRPARSFRVAVDKALRWPARMPEGIGFTALAVKIGGGRPRPVLTDAGSVQELLEAMGVRLGKADKVRPSATANLVRGMRVRVVQIRQVVETAQVAAQFETLIQYSTDLDAGQEEVRVPGAPGVAVHTFRVTYRNGREVARVLLSETLLNQPKAEVLVVGTNPTPIADSGVQYGQASWYDWDICDGPGLTAAHVSLPKGTEVTVTNVDNGKTVTVVINDRGPYGVPGRIIDLCDDAFVQIAPLGQGVADVSISW